MTRLACSRSLRCTVPSCVCRSGWALGCDVRSEQFGRRGGHRAGAEPASRESENRHFFRGPGRGGLDEGASARRSRASRRIVRFRWGSATGSRANRRFRPRPRLFIPLVLFLGSKQFFDLCLGYPIFWYPTVAPEPRAGVWDTLPEVFSRLLFLSGSCRVCFILAILVGARERTRWV